MDLFEAIRERHCYRGAFLDRPVPREDLTKIVQAGLAAPSGCNAQTTTFVIVDDSRLKEEIGKVLNKPVVKQAAAMIVCVVEHRTVYQDMSFGVEDCAAAVENMLLAVTALGYASVWIDGALRSDQKIASRIVELLKIPADREVRILLPIGVPAEKGPRKEKLPFAERAWFNSYRS